MALDPRTGRYPDIEAAMTRHVPVRDAYGKCAVCGRPVRLLFGRLIHDNRPDR